jgi:hypothetical protein
MHVRTTSIRAKANEVLTEDQLRQVVPSLYADAPHTSRSERYAHIPSTAIMAGLADAGFMPVAAIQSRSREDDRRGFAKHLIRFRHQNATMRAVGDTVPEVVLKNSHDGSSSYSLMAGLFRLACLNGMVIEAGEIAAVRVKHTGRDILQEVIDGAKQVLDASVRALEGPRQWSRIALSTPERVALAESAHTLRFADADGNVDTPIKPAQLLVPRRHTDSGHDLWTTYNVIQENVIRGGLQASTRGANGRLRRVTTRQINGIDQDVKLNKALWQLGAKMAELKAA